MANAPLTLDVIAKEALMILDNNLIAAKMVHRGYEDEFGNAMNGFEAGDTISIRRPTDFTVRDGPVSPTRTSSRRKSASSWTSRRALTSASPRKS
jgi:hypothetical protein